MTAKAGASTSWNNWHCWPATPPKSPPSENPSMKLHYQQRAYAFRSPGLFVFLRLLQNAYPGWVDKAAIENRMPGVDPRQLAPIMHPYRANCIRGMEKLSIRSALEKSR